MKRIIRIVSLLLVILILSSCGKKEEVPVTNGGSMVLTFITIGKGDAFLLSSPEGEHYLIDTGKQSDFPQIARILKIKNVDTLNGIFLSHGHLDHAGGLESILNAFSVEKIYLSAVDTVSYQKIDAEAIAKEHNIPVEKISGGDVLTSGEMSIRCWIPEKAVIDNENNNSVVLRVSYGKTAFLMMGDAELEEETDLLESGEDLHADILKLGHHGENDATSLALLEKVKPQYGLVTGNQEENPDSLNSDVSARLLSIGTTPIYSESDGLGIDFSSNGEQITTRTVNDQDSPVDSPLVLLGFDRQNQRVEVKNTGTESVDLGGYTLFSKRGGEVFRFPNNTLLASGESITVSCRSTWREGYLIWDEDKVWKKNDGVCLYDCKFTLLDELTD